MELLRHKTAEKRKVTRVFLGGERSASVENAM